MKPIYLADMSDSELQILLGDVQKEIHKRGEILCETALEKLGHAIKEVQDSNFNFNFTLASGEVFRISDIIYIFSYPYNKIYYIDKKEKISNFSQPEEVKHNENGTVECIHAYDDVDCYSCVNRHICWSED